VNLIGVDNPAVAGGQNIQEGYDVSAEAPNALQEDNEHEIIVTIDEDLSTPVAIVATPNRNRSTSLFQERLNNEKEMMAGKKRKWKLNWSFSTTNGGERTSSLRIPKSNKG